MAYESRLSITIDSRNAEQKAKDLQRGLSALEDAGVRVTQSTKATSQSIQEQRRDLEQLVGRIDPVVGRLGQLDKMEQQLRQHHKAGLLPKDDFDLYLKKLNETRNGLGGFSEVVERVGLSAGEQSQALRQLPLQFQDIFVSLQAGQSPMQVAIQQGSQIAGSFGGVGAALKQSAIYATGLINPFTLGAGAVAALGYSAYSASEQTADFNKALALTNNYAGTSQAQLEALSDSISDQVGSAGAAREALLAMASDGRFSFEQIEVAAASVVSMNKATGESIEDLIQNYKDISDDPVTALQKLDDQYHFLDLSTIQHIQSLIDQGKTQEAVTLATQEWADESAKASQRVIDNLSGVDTVLNSLKEGFSTFFGGLGDELNQGVSRALGLFDAGSNLDRINSLEEQLTGIYSLGNKALGREDDLRAELAIRQSIVQMAEIEAQINAEIARTESDHAQEYISNSKIRNSLLQQYQSRQDQLLAKQEEINKTYDEAIKSAGSQEEINKLQKEREGILAQLNERYVENTRLTDAQRKALQAAKAAEREYQKQLEASRKVVDAAFKTLSPAGDLLADYRDRVEQVTNANAYAINPQLEMNAAVAGLAISYNEATGAASGYTKALALQRQEQQALALSGQNNALSVAGIGMGDQELQRAQEMLQIQQDYLQKQNQLREQYNAGDIAEEDYQRQLSIYQSFAQQRIAQQQQMYSAMDIAQDDWLEGASAAWANFEADAENTASSMESLFSGALDSTSDALADFVTTGKLSFSDLANSIIKDLARIGVQKAIVGMAGSLFGGSSGGESGGSVEGLFASGGYVSGPGTGTSDSIPARLSNGEFVINAAATSQYRPLLESINSGRGYADGGYVTNGAVTNNTTSNSTSVGAPVIQQTFHITGDSSSDLESRLRQAADEGAQRGAKQGYQMMLQDFSKNSTGMQLVRKGIK